VLADYTERLRRRVKDRGGRTEEETVIRRLKD
jgi:hypothetical protein